MARSPEPVPAPALPPDQDRGKRLKGRESPRRGFTLPPALRNALAEVFEVPTDAIDRVHLVEQSRFARLHGRRVAATTRRGTIYLAGSGRRFVADPELVLHEYFHVLRQWDIGTLTTWRYVIEWLRRGYRSNRYEVEARAFTRRHVLAFAASLRSHAPTTIA